MIGHKIKQARLKLGMSQRELAEKTGMKQPNISAIESFRVPTLATLKRICEVLGVDIGEIV